MATPKFIYLLCIFVILAVVVAWITVYHTKKAPRTLPVIIIEDRA